jgi:predicted MPP superfamily phosphohydrolase
MIESIQEKHDPALMTRRKFLYGSIMATTSIAVVGCVGGIVSRNNIEITKTTIALPNLPPEFKGTTITLASDIHSGHYMELDEMKNIVRLINDLKSDIILLPGDFVTTHLNELPPVVEALSALHAPMGVFATTGNHEFYVGADEISEGIVSAKIAMLRNENFAIKKNGASLYLLGIDDKDADDINAYIDGKPAPHVEATFSGVPENAATILMNHKPYRFEEYAKTNVGLMLSGHTHGGQIVLARFGKRVITPSAFASKYIEGLYTPDNQNSRSQMYVSRGLGTVALPMRLNCPPEITQITLV